MKNNPKTPNPPHVSSTVVMGGGTGRTAEAMEARCPDCRYLAGPDGYVPSHLENGHQQYRPCITCGGRG